MTRRGQDKVIRLDVARGNKRPSSPKEARLRLLQTRPQEEDPFLLPAKLPYPEPSSLLANIPRNKMGAEYVLTMRDRFPKSYFIDNAYRSCRLERIEIDELQSVGNERRTLVYTHEESSDFPLLKAPITSSCLDPWVEVANIIADPLGYDVFWDFITRRPCATFHTSAFGQFPVNSIDHKAVWDFNFSG